MFDSLPKVRTIDPETAKETEPKKYPTEDLDRIRKKTASQLSCINGILGIKA